jgi:hypothetical protein
MASIKSSRVNPKYKTKYRVQNWPEYERGLRARGDVTIWFAEEAIKAWTPSPNRRRGGQRCYSNQAILTALTLRTVFHLPLRQTEGFVASLLRLMGMDLQAPDHTTLCRRARDVELPGIGRHHDGPVHLIVDSTGLKIYGAGEWCSRKHRKAGERGGWRKLHIGVDGDGYVVAEVLTENTADDADMVPTLLGQVDAPLRRITGDGGYDKRGVYDAVAKASDGDVEMVIPPRRAGANSQRASGVLERRNRNLERIGEVGRQAWQKETGYRQQGRVEGTFLRYRRTLGSRLRARGTASQKLEARLGCLVLNKMYELEKARSYAVIG